MKNKLFLGLMVVCFVAALAALMMSNRTQAQEAPQSPSLASLNYKLIAGVHRLDYMGDSHVGTSYTIYNISLQRNVTLGNVHVIDTDGTSLVWNGVNGTVIPPIGSYGFTINDTGVSPHEYDRPGSWLIAITWDGQEEDIRIVGQTNYWYPPEAGLTWEAARTITPF